PCLYYYEWNPKTLNFTRHLIHRGEAGAGLQVRVGDLNGDGRLDIAVAGKSGTYILFNEGR
ncbi:MAG TPA: VCBS repeat-containing protein, partial [Planctomycetaceae bacterium]|nr:VCBS repeat-containing protein [Planctomycetaceae bacterium]